MRNLEFENTGLLPDALIRKKTRRIFQTFISRSACVYNMYFKGTVSVISRDPSMFSVTTVPLKPLTDQ